MPILADTNAIVHGGKTNFRDDPAESAVGFPVTDAILQARRSNFTITNLGTTTKIYTCSTKSSLQQLAEFYISYGGSVEMEEGPVYKLTVNLPWDEITNLDTDPSKFALWEITPHAIERDIFRTGIYSPSVQGGQISTTRLKVNNYIKAAIEQSYKNPTMTVNLSVQKQWASAQYLAETYLALKRLRAEGVSAFTQTLKRTLILNSRTTAFGTDPLSENSATVNYIISSTDMVSAYSVPAAIQPYMLPSYSKFITVDGQDPVNLVVLGGYIAKRPTIQMVTPNKLQFTQEFVWDEWLDSLYKPYGGITRFPEIQFDI
jgi:hypothetical protein